MSADRFESASGLRPASAFVAIAAVLGFVGLRGAKMTLADPGSQPDCGETALGAPPDFEIHDRYGVPLAFSVDRLSIEMSPNAMWQAHTPDHMARRLSATLGGRPSSAELLERMLPDAYLEGGTPGVIDVERPVASAEAEDVAEPGLSPAQTARLQAWLDTGDARAWQKLPGHGATTRPVRGMWLERIAGLGRYRLRWRPAVLLSKEVREQHGVERPQAWSRTIADALVTCVYGETPRRIAGTANKLEELRERVWRALMPSQHKVVLGAVPPDAALPLRELFVDEWVHPHQMKLRRDLTRRYPVRGVPGGDLDRVAPAGRVEDPPAPGQASVPSAEAPPFEILGRWGTCDPDRARRDERRRLGLPAEGPCPPELQAELDRAVHARVWRPHPQTGLERLCGELLADPAWAFLERDPGRYDYLATRVVRQPARRYFREVTPPSELPAVRTTLDAALQRRLREVLVGVMEEHDPALAMGIAVEVATGEVLAVDALDAYQVSGYVPVWHAFTPGSTFKLVTMAAALEAGVVHPEDVLDTFDGGFVTGSHRINEARGAPTGRITATEAIAGSSNAVMAQIGMRIDDATFRATLAALGYGHAPGTGLPTERRGTLPGLPWKLDWTHASISFGHEILVTFWQHATALTTIVRGGEHLPLRLLRSVEQNHVLHAVPPAAPRRVLSERTCAEVRAMMRVGALEGTGDDVAVDHLWMGTKTGTAQKVDDEICLHAELAHRAEHNCPNGACRRSLKGVRPGHKSCYTSSMVTFGRLPGDEREVLVFVVVDEPRGRAKFGADVAGRAAVAILDDALRRGAPVLAASADAGAERGTGAPGAPPAWYVGSDTPAEQPWAESLEETR